MRTKIALFGSESFCQRALQFTKQRSDILLDLYSYRVPHEAKELITSLRPCDAILFSGSLPYLAAKHALDAIPIPATYLKQDETEIATTLLSISLKQSFQLDKLSIDVPDITVLNNVLADIQSSNQQPHIYPLTENYSLQELVKFHQKSAEEGQTTIAITSVHAAYDCLLSLGIPVHKMVSVKSSFLQAVDVLSQDAMLQKSESFKMVVGSLEINQATAIEQTAIERLTETLHAHCMSTDNTLLLYTTQGALQTALQRPEFKQATDVCKGHIAFGSGHTLTSAKENAVSALNYMKDNQTEGLYLLDENKVLHNLLHLTEDTIELRVIEPLFTEMAEKTALSPAVLSKLTQFGQSHQSTQFTANDLATYMDVSRRTAERTIKKLASSDYIHTVGEEMTYRQGRPRAIYELNFPVY